MILWLKKLTIQTAITALFLSLIPLTSNAAKSQPNPTYQRSVQNLYREIGSIPKEHQSKVKQVFDALFKPTAIKISFRGVTEKGKQRTITTTGAIYFSKGEIFITQNLGTEEHIATLNGKIYAWKPKYKVGEILTRAPEDTIDFLFYKLDPSFIMMSIYQNYLKAPTAFTVTQVEGSKRLLAKRPYEGFAGIQIRENPFWFNGLLLQNPKDSNGELYISEIDPPIAIPTIPVELKKLPTGVRFTPSPATLKTRMVFL